VGREPAGAARRLFWWGVVGGAATLSYASLAWLLTKGADLPAAFASVVAYAVSACLSYVGHRHLTFRSRRSHGEAVSAFVGVSIVGYGAAFLVPAVITGLLGAPVEVSILLTCVTVPTLTYLGLSRFVFRTSR
jgi:putative flippase GtrA